MQHDSPSSSGTVACATPELPTIRFHAVVLDASESECRTISADTKLCLVAKLKAMHVRPDRVGAVFQGIALQPRVTLDF